MSGSKTQHSTDVATIEEKDRPRESHAADQSVHRHLSCDMFVHVQVVRTDLAHMHSPITRTRVTQAQQGVRKIVRHPRVMSRPLPHSTDASKRKEKQWSIGNPSSIMPEAYVVFTSLIPRMRNSLKIMENAHRKLEIPMPAAMPCRTPIIKSNRKTCSNIGKHRTKYACVVEADESMRLRWKEFSTGITKITLQQKERIHWGITIWCISLFWCLKH